MFSLDALFCDVDDVLIQSLQVGEPAQRAESLLVACFLYPSITESDSAFFNSS